MIEIKDKTVYCQTQNTSYWFGINDYQHPVHYYFGPKIPLQDVAPLQRDHVVAYGSSVELGYLYSLDQEALEISFSGKGDFREVAYEISDLKQDALSHLRVTKVFLNDHIDFPKAFFYPRITDSVQQVVVQLVDDYHPIRLELFYTVYEEEDVILRHQRIINEGADIVLINRLMSLQLDLNEQGFEVITANGTWGREAQLTKDRINSGTLIHQSRTGASSNLSNPGLILKKPQICYGFNLIYSGNHYNSVSVNYDGSTRVLSGINPQTFSWNLKPQESFETPLAICTTGHTEAQVSNHFHQFIKNRIVPTAPFPKPITYNHWEGTFFDYNHKKLISFAKKAKECGMDLFVIDDGWFGKRDQDNCSLGDYFENTNKFPQGLKNTIQQIRDLGLKVGLWVEPEMISEDSECYRQHPHWVVGKPNHLRAKGRNQWILDLCQTEVQDYIVDHVGRLIDEYQVDYIKWDMNRHHSDQFSCVLENQKEFDVRFQMALVSILRRIFIERKHVFLEMCSSGGNRFDLGMLSVAQQIWTSDNTDAMDRLKIQEGTALFYPLSVLSNHVSGKINTQTLRKTSLSTRFNVACFGALGYELDLNLCSKVELDEIKEQIEFYKKVQELILKGDFMVTETDNPNRVCWQVKNGKQALVGYFGKMNSGLQPREKLRVLDLESQTMYSIESKPQRLMLDQFGELLKHVAKFPIHPYGSIMNLLSHYKTIQDGVFKTSASGALLAQGIVLNDLYLGTGYHESIRLWGDFGSTLYVVKEIENET